MKIEVKTYEESRLDFFKDLARKAEKKLDKCIKAMKKSDYNNPLSEKHIALDDAVEKKGFYCDIVDMLCLERKETSKEEQIEAPPKIQPIDFNVNDKRTDEMRKLVIEMEEAISTEHRKRLLADEIALEEVLKANGWRKASDVAREIFEEIERFLYMHFRFCKEEIGNDDTEYVKGRLELNTQMQNLIAELKKKYTEEGK